MPAPFIDISRPVHPGMAVWPGDPETSFERVLDLSRGDLCTVTRLTLCAHAGTHLDAPSHYLPGAPDISAMPLSAGIGRARVIGIHNPVAITADELSGHGIRRGERLLFRTANSTRRPADPAGPVDPAPFTADFVAVAMDAARYLAEKQVRLVGVDGPSVGAFPDPSAGPAETVGPEEPQEATGPLGPMAEDGQAGGDAVHRLLLAAGVWLLEGLDLSGLSPGPVELVCLPLRLVGAEGAPARAVARQLARPLARAVARRRARV
ncbi:MAG: cyclase family protein [Desulfovibrionaceae bacterium]|nr:cyclase family protein [Desulfovibrionaceae bacterium]